MRNTTPQLKRPRLRWILLATTVLLAFVAIWQISRIATQIRKSEEEKVRIWAAAIGQRAELVAQTEQFFAHIAEDEHAKMEFYTRAQQIAVSQQLNNSVSLFFTDYITANHSIPVIITDDRGYIMAHNNIDIPEDVDKLEGNLYKEFTQEPPIPYHVWGMPFTLYYKESKLYSDLRYTIDNLTQSFLSDITNNSVAVPVLVVDSLQEFVLGSGNIAEKEFNTPERLSEKICEMQEANDPIVIAMPDNHRAYVFYENTPLLKSLRWIPILYIFVIFVLILISYNLFRTAQSNEQNRIWVGLAKETAHQLGTPISSLIAWNEYLEGKTYEKQYAEEIRKDLNRLETITHRFSKIGSVPEMSPENVCEVIQGTLNYLQTRTSRNVKFVSNFPDEQLIIPLNRYLFEWVIENICKNAIDAMNGNGTFTVIVTSDTHNVIIDLCDTGKGMSPAVQKQIFQSGFTTKTRGWGLGLSLARRIINEYHRGKIFLKYSVEGQGTVFRILLRKEADGSIPVRSSEEKQ
ncbi:MAG: HAMP domain-containing histidine kinase [Bacteroidales bacterium]|nr:HAMP domain-containing histidine kinase [Bacteroidales bacterium]